MTDDLVALGLSLASHTRVVEVGRGVLARSGVVLRDALLADGGRALVVADERTWAAAGERVRTLLDAAGVDCAEPLIFPGRPSLYATLDACAVVEARLADSGAVGIAVGSGTVNDLVKLASGNLGRPYGVVGTAASMDGYSGFGAPMESHGVKATHACPAPVAVVIDLDVTAAAPASMVGSGYGDLSAKLPAGADWILADAAGVEPIEPLAWRLVQDGVRDALARPAELAAGDADAFGGLVRGLVLSGLAMQAIGGTRPASGAEHYFSHLWELAHLGADREPPLSHGFKVAIGTLAMSAFYERFLARDLSNLDLDAVAAAWRPWSEIEADIRTRFTGALADHAVAQTHEKFVDADGVRDRIGRLRDDWVDIRARLRAQLLPARELAAMLRAAGAPSTPADIGLTPEAVRATFPDAMYYRNRYTVLDVARELGWFDELVDEVFAPGGLWT